MQKKDDKIHKIFFFVEKSTNFEIRKTQIKNLTS